MRLWRRGPGRAERLRIMRSEVAKSERKVAELQAESEKNDRVAVELERLESLPDDWADFQRYCVEHDIRPTDRLRAFEAWMNERTAGQDAPSD